jgi:hypothetical protein
MAAKRSLTIRPLPFFTLSTSVFTELNACLADRWRAMWEESRHPEHEQFSVSEMPEHERAHYILLLQRKPGALRNEAPFTDMPERLRRLRRGCCATRAGTA